MYIFASFYAIDPNTSLVIQLVSRMGTPETDVWPDFCRMTIPSAAQQIWWREIKLKKVKENENELNYSLKNRIVNEW